MRHYAHTAPGRTVRHCVHSRGHRTGRRARERTVYISGREVPLAQNNGNSRVTAPSGPPYVNICLSYSSECSVAGVSRLKWMFALAQMMGGLAKGGFGFSVSRRKTYTPRCRTNLTGR